MKKSLLIFIALSILPLSASHRGNDGNGKNKDFNPLVGAIILGGCGGLVYYWWNRTPATPAAPVNNPTLQQQPGSQQHNPVVRLNKLDQPSPEDRKKLDDLLSASRKPAPSPLSEKTEEPSPKLTPIVCAPTQKEPAKIVTNEQPKTTPTIAKGQQPIPKVAPAVQQQQSKPIQEMTEAQKTTQTNGVILCHSFEKITNRANPANIDNATNDYLDIITGY